MGRIGSDAEGLSREGLCSEAEDVGGGSVAGVVVNVLGTAGAIAARL